MTRNTIKLRPQEAEIPERKVRLRLPGRLAADLDSYRALYTRAHGQEIDLPALVEAIVDQFLASDRVFRRHRRLKETSTDGSDNRTRRGSDLLEPEA